MIIDKREYYTTAKSVAINAYCSIKDCAKRGDVWYFLCNFGYRDVWTPEHELTGFQR